EFLHDTDLCGREAVGPVLALTLETLRIEVAASRIFEYSVCHTIASVAGVQNGFVQYGELRRWDQTARRIIDCPSFPDCDGREMRQRRRRRAGNNAVIVGRVTLRFRECLFSPP